jgi:hypothetical protein
MELTSIYAEHKAPCRLNNVISVERRCDHHRFRFCRLVRNSCIFNCSSFAIPMSHAHMASSYSQIWDNWSCYDMRAILVNRHSVA